MKIFKSVILVFLLEAILQLHCSGGVPPGDSTRLMGNRFLYHSFQQMQKH
jgi:hypothetical protein